MNLEVYMIGRTDGDGNWMELAGPYTDIRVARKVASNYSAQLMAYIYEYSDSELLEDYSHEED